MTTYLLDTHVIHWWSAEPNRLSRAAARAVGEADELAVAAISWFELAWLAAHERIVLTIPVRSWLDQLAREVRTMPLTKLLLLDEPTTGLDPGGMRDMRLLVQRLAGQGITIVLSSHLLAEVEEVCNRVAIVRTGTIVYEGMIADLKRAAGMSYRLATTNDERALAVARAQPGVEDAQTDKGRITFTAEEQVVAELSQALVEAGALIKELAPHGATLEDLFFSLTEDGAGAQAADAEPAGALEGAR